MSFDFCPLPDPDVGPSIIVCDVEHTSFHFGLCGRKFVLCLFGQCPGLCTICHISWQHTGVVHRSVSVFGVCSQSTGRTIYGKNRVRTPPVVRASGVGSARSVLEVNGNNAV